MEEKLTLYRVKADKTVDFDETQEAIVWAVSEHDALIVFFQAVQSDQKPPGMWSAARNTTYRAIPVPIERGAVLGFGWAG